LTNISLQHPPVELDVEVEEALLVPGLAGGPHLGRQPDEVARLVVVDPASGQPGGVRLDGRP
jgi:hypothetical protein